MQKHIFIATLLSILLSANAFAKETIPFIGCPGLDGSDGPGIEPAIQGHPVSVNLNPVIAEQLAFYTGPNEPGLIAPKSWQCFWIASTDGNYSIVVAPNQKDLLPFRNFGSADVTSAAISYEYWNGGTAGRDVVIPLAGHFFPKLHNGGSKNALTTAVASGEISNDQLVHNYPLDITSYHSSDILEFITLANHDGFGTWGHMLPKSNLPISGFVRIDWTGDTAAEIVRVRLPSNLDYLRIPILNNFETDLRDEDKH